MRVHGGITPPQTILVTLRNSAQDVLATIDAALEPHKNSPLLAKDDWVSVGKHVRYYTPTPVRIITRANDWLVAHTVGLKYADDLRQTAITVIESAINVLAEAAKEENGVSPRNLEDFYTTTTFAEVLKVIHEWFNQLTSTEYEKDFESFLNILDLDSEKVIFDAIADLDIPESDLVYSRYRFLSNRYWSELKIGRQISHSRRLFSRDVIRFNTLQEFEVAIKEQAIPIFNDMFAAWFRYMDHRGKIIRAGNRTVDIHGVPVLLTPKRPAPTMVDIGESVLIPVTTITIREYTRESQKKTPFSKKIKELTKTSTREKGIQLLLDESDSSTRRPLKAYSAKDFTSNNLAQIITDSLRKAKALDEFERDFKVFGVAYYGIVRLVQNMFIAPETLYFIQDYMDTFFTEYYERLEVGASLGVILFIELSNGSVIKLITQVVDYASHHADVLPAIEDKLAYVTEAVGKGQRLFFKQVLAAPHNFYAFSPSTIGVAQTPRLLL